MFYGREVAAIRIKYNYIYVLRRKNVDNMATWAL